MEDQRDPHYTPFAKPAAAKVREPGELLCNLQKDHVAWSCELVFRGESYGWEARVLRRGELVMSKRFVLRAHAVEWSETQQADVERGWIDD